MKNAVLILFLVFTACQKNSYSVQLKNGDFLLIGNSEGNLSKAITDVTKNDKTANYSHIALVEKEGKELPFL